MVLISEFIDKAHSIVCSYSKPNRKKSIFTVSRLTTEPLAGSSKGVSVRFVLAGRLADAAAYLVAALAGGP